MSLRALIAAAALVLAATSANANVLIRVDKSTQRMTVSVDGETKYVFSVSTGVARYDTPDGNFTPFRMEKDHFSKEWDDAPMPYSIFFTKQGHAIHGTNHTSLGRPASHGCVRLSVANAAKLWELVTAEGIAKTKVVLTGELPTSDLIAKRKRNDDDRTTGSAVVETYPDGRRSYSAQDDYYYGRRYTTEQPYPYYRQQPYYQPAPAPVPFWFGGR